MCHLIELTAPPHSKLEAGQEYATTAGTWVGEHEHSHFIFKVTSQGGEYLLDPWILFREIFEAGREKRGEPRAAFVSPGPVRAWDAAVFSSAGSRGSEGAELFWTFGDGGAAAGAEVEHVFARAGVYPVTLTLETDGRRTACTQLVTVDGEVTDRAVLALEAGDEPSFRERPPWACDVYGEAPALSPRTLRFTARESRPVPAKRYLTAVNAGGDHMDKPWVTGTEDAPWLTVEPEHYAGAERLAVSADAAGLEPGVYR
ncbi:MAG: PKD domain-containing protein, partial [Planctomycetota bacterium]